MLIKALGVPHTFKESEFFMVRCKCCQKPIMHYDHTKSTNKGTCACGNTFDLNRMVQPIDLYGRWFFKINRWHLKDQYDVVTKDGQIHFNLKPNYIYFAGPNQLSIHEHDVMFMRLVGDDRIQHGFTGEMRVQRNHQYHGLNAVQKQDCFYEGSLLVLEL